MPRAAGLARRAARGGRSARGRRALARASWVAVRAASEKEAEVGAFVRPCSCPASTCRTVCICPKRPQVELVLRNETGAHMPALRELAYVYRVGEEEGAPSLRRTAVCAGSRLGPVPSAHPTLSLSPGPCSLLATLPVPPLPPRAAPAPRRRRRGAEPRGEPPPAASAGGAGRRRLPDRRRVHSGAGH